MSSRKMPLSDTGIALDGDWRGVAQRRGRCGCDRVRAHSRRSPAARAGDDCTASDAIAACYHAGSPGIHIARRTSGRQQHAGLSRSAASGRRAAGTHFLYEAIVGAALPVINVRDLRETGDDSPGRRHFVGTLAYLQRVGWTAAVFRGAVRCDGQGYTEPMLETICPVWMSRATDHPCAKSIEAGWMT